MGFRPPVRTQLASTAGVLLSLIGCGASAPPQPALERYEPESAARRESIQRADTDYRDDEGTGWILRDGTFESAVSALRVRAGGPWEFTAARDAAEFVLSYGDGVLLGTRLVTNDPASSAAQVLSSYAASSTPGELEGQLPFVAPDGTQHALALTHFIAQETSFLVAIAEGDGAIWIFQVLFAEGQGEAALAAIAELPPPQGLGGDELARLEAERLAHMPAVLADGASLRNGRFVHFPVGVELELPTAFWSAALSRGALIEASDPVRRIRFTLGHTRLEETDADASARAHEALRAQLEGELTPRSEATLGELSGFVSECTFGEGLLARRKRALSALRQTSEGAEVVWWLVEAPPSVFAAEEERIRTIERSLRFGPARESIRQEGAHFEDLRLRIAFDAPEGFDLQVISAPYHGAYLLRGPDDDASSEIAVFAFPTRRALLSHRERVLERIVAQFGEATREGDTLRWENGVRVDAEAVDGTHVLVVDLTRRGSGASVLESLQGVAE